LDLSDEEIDGVYENVHDLTQVYQVKSVEDLQSLLDDHFYCEEETVTKVEKKPLQKKEVAKKETPKKKVVVDEDPTDDIPMFHESDKKTSDPDVDDLLAELDID
jgi:hypothetical protein